VKEGSEIGEDSARSETEAPCGNPEGIILSRYSPLLEGKEERRGGKI